MAANFPGTFEVRLFYTTNEPASIAAHELRLSLEMGVEADPGDPFADWFPVQKDGDTDVDLGVQVDALVAVLQPNWNTAVDIVSAELWEYAPGTFDAIFRSAYTIGENGTAASATVDYSQAIWTLRSQLGGIMKVDMRGVIHVQSFRQTYPTAVASVDNIFLHIMSGQMPWHARDGGYAIAPVAWLSGQNERAFKEVNR